MRMKKCERAWDHALFVFKLYIKHIYISQNSKKEFSPKQHKAPHSFQWPLRRHISRSTSITHLENWVAEREKQKREKEKRYSFTIHQSQYHANKENHKKERKKERNHHVNFLNCSSVKQTRLPKTNNLPHHLQQFNAPTYTLIHHFHLDISVKK